MARNRLPRLTDERLDRAGSAVVRSAARAGAEAEEAAYSPFLYTRVRARVEERKRREAEAGAAGWLALLQVARRAVPTMAFVAALAAALLFWAAPFGARQQQGGRAGERFAFVSDELVFGADAGVESAVLRDNGQLSHDEILNMVVNRGGGREGVSR